MHSFSAWVINYDTGNKTRSCSGCGKVETTSISAEECVHPASEIRNQKDPTCGSDGYSGDSCCTACNEILTAGRVLHATGDHTFSEMVVVVAPEFLKEGQGKHVCVDCQEEMIVSIPAISTGADSMSVEELLSYVESDAEKILLLLALGASDGVFVDSIKH